MYWQPKKKLPIRVLHPTRNYRFIAFVKRMLQKYQAAHYPCAYTRPPEFFGVAIVDCRVELSPIDSLSDHKNRGLGVQEFAQVGAKELALRSRIFWLQFLPAFGTKRIKTRQILAPSKILCTLKF